MNAPAITPSAGPRWNTVAAVIAAARPDIRRNGGDIDLIDITGDRVRLMQVLGEPVRVLPG